MTGVQTCALPIWPGPAAAEVRGELVERAGGRGGAGHGRLRGGHRRRAADSPADLPARVSAVVALLSGIIAVSMMIPGEQPEKALKGAVEFLEKFSKK